MLDVPELTFCVGSVRLTGARTSKKCLLVKILAFAGPVAPPTTARRAPAIWAGAVEAGALHLAGPGRSSVAARAGPRRRAALKAGSG